MKVIWSLLAKRDLRELIANIAEESIQGAELVAARILKTAEVLAGMPHSGRIGRVSGTREKVVRRTPYILVYRIISRRVRVLRVYHGARRWPARF
jgi:toxin ParE1/3/4